MTAGKSKGTIRSLLIRARIIRQLFRAIVELPWKHGWNVTVRPGCYVTVGKLGCYGLQISTYNSQSVFNSVFCEHTQLN